MFKKLNKEITELFINLNNKYCEDYVEDIWDVNLFIRPKKDSNDIVEKKIIHIYYEYLIATESDELNIPVLEKIREELRTI